VKRLFKKRGMAIIFGVLSCMAIVAIGHSRRVVAKAKLSTKKKVKIGAGATAAAAGLAVVGGAAYKGYQAYKQGQSSNNPPPAEKVQAPEFTEADYRAYTRTAPINQNQPSRLTSEELITKVKAGGPGTAATPDLETLEKQLNDLSFASRVTDGTNPDTERQIQEVQAKIEQIKAAQPPEKFATQDKPAQGPTNSTGEGQPVTTKPAANPLVDAEGAPLPLSQVRAQLASSSQAKAGAAKIQQEAEAKAAQAEQSRQEVQELVKEVYPDQVIDPTYIAGIQNNPAKLTALRAKAATMRQEEQQMENTLEQEIAGKREGVLEKSIQNEGTIEKNTTIENETSLEGLAGKAQNEALIEDSRPIIE